MTAFTHYAGGPRSGQTIASTQTTNRPGTEGGFFAITNELDLAQGHSSSNNGTAIAKGGTDTFALIDIPANTHVLCTYATVLRAEGDTGTMDLGLTGGDVDAFLDGIDINAAVGTTVSGAATAGNGLAVGGQFFTSADTLDLLGVTGTANAAAKLRVTALCFSPAV